MKIEQFEDLECWKEARTLTSMVFSLTQSAGATRQYRLIDQVTGAAISVMNNIVEGFDSGSDIEFSRFLGYARRSASEVQSCLYVALDNGITTQEQFDLVYGQAEKARKVIDGLRRYLRSSGRNLDGPTGRRADGPTNWTGRQADRPTGGRT